MSMEAHLEALKRRHRELESELHQLYRAPSADMLAVKSLKREKLRLKDEIERLSRTETARRA
jgi:hypothetical protein